MRVMTVSLLTLAGLLVAVGSLASPAYAAACEFDDWATACNYHDGEWYIEFTWDLRIESCYNPTVDVYRRLNGGSTWWKVGWDVSSPWEDNPDWSLGNWDYKFVLTCSGMSGCEGDTEIFLNMSCP